MKIPVSRISSCQLLVIAIVFALSPAISSADDESGEGQSSIFSGIFGEGESRARGERDDGGNDGDEREERTGRFSRGESGEEGDDKGSRRGRFFKGKQENGDGDDDED